MVRKMNAARAEHQAETEVSADPQFHQAFLRSAPADHLAVESPARRLQIQLYESLSNPPAERWSARRSLLVVFATNAALWTMLIAAARSLF